MTSKRGRSSARRFREGLGGEERRASEEGARDWSREEVCKSLKESLGESLKESLENKEISRKRGSRKRGSRRGREGSRDQSLSEERDLKVEERRESAAKGLVEESLETL